MLSPFHLFHLSALTAPQIIYNSSCSLPGAMYYCFLWFLMQLMIMVVLLRLLTCQLWVPVIVMESALPRKSDWLSPLRPLSSHRISECAFEAKKKKTTTPPNAQGGVLCEIWLLVLCKLHRHQFRGYGVKRNCHLDIKWTASLLTLSDFSAVMTLRSKTWIKVWFRG